MGIAHWHLVPFAEPTNVVTVRVELHFNRHPNHMARVLMLVHGMGVHGADWATDLMIDLTTAATAYGLDGDFSDELHDDRVTLAPISYDGRFVQWVEKWGNDSRELAKFVRQNSIAMPADLVSWLDSADETENNFVWSHVVDVLLYRFFTLVSTDVHVHVARDIATVWRDALAMDPNAEVSVLAHSLGTSVTHDTLALLATSPPANAEGFLAGAVRLANFFQVANVSRILETSPNVYDSVMAPPSVRGDKAYCGNFFNVRHRLDPFTVPRSFDPPWTGEDYVRVGTKAIRDFNVHDIGHYVHDPRVHIPIFRALFGFEAIDETTASNAIEEYDNATGSSCPAQLAAFVQSCEQRVQRIHSSTDIKTLIAEGVHFLADVQQARKACGEVF